MQVTHKNTISKVAEKLSAISYQLPFHHEQAWLFSVADMEKYLSQHVNTKSGMNAKRAGLMAAARLNWLLERTRPSLSLLFSESDVFVLLDCYLGDLLYTSQIDNIASDVCNHLGIELDEYQARSIGPLINALRDLNSIQRLTLADALEQLCHRRRGISPIKPRNFLASIGIILK
jgi:hypothetical protein